MFLMRLFVSLFEFLLAVVMSGCVIYVTYRIFIRANPDFNMEDEIKKGNIATGLLVGTILICASNFLQKGMSSVVSMFRLYITAPAQCPLPFYQMVLLGTAHLAFSMFLAVLTISITLRLFGRLTSHMQEGRELQKGNVAVGILLSSVVIVATLYVSEGVSSLSKALVPQPSIGRIQVLK
ncbi:MAG TPA: hypothetical protein DEB40_08240 [Elusimicrobia bacterium]|nr:hypothetical protein [Elusimicrobiota bacterium]HBT61718.1 hypothetical protein [Elusimicrobiota bacterium]